MKTTQIKIVLALALGMGMAFAADAPAEGFKLNSSVQTHALKRLHDENVPYNLLDRYYIRANIGTKYTAEDVSGEFNIRAYAKQFGTTVATDVGSDGKAKKSSIDNFQIEKAFVDLKLNPMLQVRFGRWLSTYSSMAHFGNYLDNNPRELSLIFLGRVAYHDGVELSVKTGIATTAVTVAGTDKNMNTGYVRVVESIKLPNPKLIADIGWKGNVLDSLADPDAKPTLLNRFFVRVADTLIPGLVPYMEYAAIESMKDGEDDKTEFKSVAMIGVQVPTGLKNLQLNLEGEWLQDAEVADPDGDMKDRAIDWNVALTYKAGKRTKIQTYIFSDPAASTATAVEVGTRITVALN